MLRYGIVNVMSMRRTDRLYNLDNPSEKEWLEENCPDKNCLEVKIEVQRFNSLTDNSLGYQAEEIRNNDFPYINDKGGKARVPSLGFAVTEATIFAPWRPWYTGHYCAADQDNIADSACYEDYFTTQLQAPANTLANESWLRDAPAVFDPAGEETEYAKFCKSGVDSCFMYLGKVDWVKNATEPQVTEAGCDKPLAPYKSCREEVLDKTADLDRQFNASIQKFADVGRYPWSEAGIDNLAAGLNSNPFIGFYELIKNGENAFDKKRGIFLPSLFKGTHYVLPERCTKADYLGARKGKSANIQQLEDCVLNFEIHTSGFHEQWKELYGGKLPLEEKSVREISKAIVGIDANQYGRTMFMYAGVPEQHVAVSFKLQDDGLSIHDKVYNASIYTQYLPMVNPADSTLLTKSYTDDFWHAFFMSNHMNQTPDHFIRGIRGRTLWHNEYRSNLIYKAAVQVGQTDIKGTRFEPILNHRDFPAGFQAQDSTSPFHGNTCDSCHIRNGSGVPLMPNGQLPQIHVDRGMKSRYTVNRDYTYSNKELPSMKMVLFDLYDDSGIVEECDDDDHTTTQPFNGFYNNKIMNFFGNSFHVNQKNKLPTYKLNYVNISGNDDFEIVDKTIRGNSSPYQPKRIKIEQINIGSSCRGIAEKPKDVDSSSWPGSCSDVSGAEIEEAINNHEIGFMHLLGRRLGNTPMIEMMPNETILETQRLQALKGIYPGCFSLAPGTRVGSRGKTNYRSCASGELGDNKRDCYIGRWGWIGDRASLEDQIANAANVEMNLTSNEGYSEVHPNPSDHNQLVRYNQTLCGPADKGCQDSQANSDITEQEIKDMGTYQRWIGIPNRSEYQVSSQKVQQGEGIFKNLQCDSCHVIKKIAFDYDDNMLPDEERDHLKKLEILSGNHPEYPFISYLGTDLLMHDMGYLSQVSKSPKDEMIRYTKEDKEVQNGDKKVGEVKKQYKNYVQKIRTPALKGLRFNRFVTDSNHNTTKPIGPKPPNDKNVIPGCDFLLHDGRACDAIEAAYLHDGPAIKDLKVIEELNNLNPVELDQLRAFLYSL